MDKNSIVEKQMGLGYKPSPDYYQTSVIELSHKIQIFQSNKDLVFNQVPIAIKQADSNYCINRCYAE